MPFNKNTQSSTSLAESDSLALAVKCLRQSRNAEAFLILSEMSLENDPVVHFSLGLCHLRAGEMQRAIACFEKALSLFKNAMVSIGGMSAVNEEAYVSLFAKQVAEKAYLEPMDVDFCSYFPKSAKQNALLALIYAHREIGAKEQAQKLAVGLVGKEFEEFKNTL